VPHQEQTRFLITRYEPVEQLTVRTAQAEVPLLSWAMLAIGRAGGQIRQISSATDGSVQTLCGIFPARCGGQAARRLRSKLRRQPGSEVQLARDRSELRVTADEIPLTAARCIWALEDRGMLPSASWIGEREFGLLVARESSAAAAAICYRVLATPAPAAAEVA
jgi:hypothetical protein